MIAEMRSQGDQLKAQVLRLEDERSAELSMFSNKMQSIKDECHEFDQQYNQSWVVGELPKKDPEPMKWNCDLRSDYSRR